MKNFLRKLVGFFKSPTGKRVEKAIWEMTALALGIVVVLAIDLEIYWLIPYVGAINQITKYINLKYIK